MEHCWQQSFSSHFFSSSKKIVIYNDDDKGKERGHSTTTLPYCRPLQQPLYLLSSLFTVLKTGLYVVHVHIVVVVLVLYNIYVAGEGKRGRCHKHCPSEWPAILNKYWILLLLLQEAPPSSATHHAIMASLRQSQISYSHRMTSGAIST